MICTCVRSTHPESELPQTQLSSQNSEWCGIKEAIADPSTGQPWKPEWKQKTEVTTDTIKKELKKQIHKQLPSSTQPSEYYPTPSILESHTQLTEEIGGLFGSLGVLPSLPVLETRSLQGFEVIIQKIGFNRGDYRIYIDSELEPTPLGSRECVGSYLEEEVGQTESPQTQIQELLSQQLVVENFEKLSQGSPQKVILVYERAVVIPDSQGFTSSSLNTEQDGPDQEQRIPETQQVINSSGQLQAGVSTLQKGYSRTTEEPQAADNQAIEVEAAQLQCTQIESGQGPRKLEEPQVAEDQTPHSVGEPPIISDQPGVATQSHEPLPLEALSQPQDTADHNFSEGATGSTREPVDQQLSTQPLSVLSAPRTLLEVRTASVLSLEPSRGNSRDLAGAQPGISPQILAVHQTQKSTAPLSDTNNIHSKKSLLEATAAPEDKETENPPIDAFESWFNNDRKVVPRRSITAAVSTRFSVLPGEGMSSAQALRERLARSREERNAKVAAARNARNTLSPHASTTSPRAREIVSRSPSIAPAESGVVGGNVGEQKALAISQSSTAWEGAQAQTTQIQAQTQTQIPFGNPYLSQAEYVIGLPLRTKTVLKVDQKTAYLNSIVGKHKEIQEFLSNPDAAGDALIRTMKGILEQSGRIATHPDLSFEKVGISNTAAEKEAEYHATMSSKFVFLRAFLGAVKHLPLRIAIVAEKGKLIDILEIFLRGIKISYTRMDKFSTLPRIPEDSLEGFVKVYLVSSSKSGVVPKTADCLIAMDSTFDANMPEIKGFRNSTVEVDKLAPVIRLVAINTIEHIRLCSPPSKEVPLHVYIETLKNLRRQVGVASQEYGSAISRAPTKISKWLQKKAEGKLDIPNIPELPLFETTTQTQTMMTTNIVSSLVGEGNDKRKRQETQTTMSLPVEAKRLRVHDPETGSSLPTVDFTHLQVGDITHVSDSMPSGSIPSEPIPSQILPVTQPQAQAEAEVVKGVVDETLASSPMELESEVEEIILGGDGVVFAEATVTTDLDIEFMSREDLVATLKRKAEDLRQWMESTGRLQTRYEELRRKFVDIKKELKKSQKTQKDAETRKERALNELAKVKDERAKLEKELKGARDSLLAGPPDKAKLEQSRAENERLEERLRSVESNLQVREKDFDFLRGLYQEASKTTLKLKEDNESLLGENSHLKKRSNEVVVQLRQIQQDNQVQARDKQIENLSLQLKEREERIARLEHERQVSTRSRGSVGMRASSVSIRGSPIQSRATSPATGVGFHGRESLTHPLRNG